MRDHIAPGLISDGLQFARGVQLLDDCEGTCNWIFTGTGGDDVHEYATVAALSGAKGLRLVTRTTGAAENDVLSAQRLLGRPESGLLIARARLMSPDISLCKQITVLLGEDDGTTQYRGEVVVSPADGKWYYTDAAGAAIEIVAAAGCPMDSQWITVELAIDTRSHEYLHASLNGSRADLSGLGLYTPGAGSNRVSWLILSEITAGAAAATIYGDNIYVGEYLET